MNSKLKLTKKRTVYLLLLSFTLIIIFDSCKPIRLRLINIEHFQVREKHYIDYLYVFENRSWFKSNSILRFKRQKSEWIEKLKSDRKRKYRIYIISDEEHWMDFDRPQYVWGKLNYGDVPYGNRIGKIEINNGEVTWETD